MTEPHRSAPISVADLRGSPARRRREAIIRGALLRRGRRSRSSSRCSSSSRCWASRSSFIQSVDPAACSDRLVAAALGPASASRRSIAGTLVIAVIAMLVATPLGLGAAIYLAEYASPRLRSWLKPILEILAAIPSVVLGFFALTVLSPDARRLRSARVRPPCSTWPAPAWRSASSSRRSSRPSPRTRCTRCPTSLREASYGLGARKRTTSVRIVVPAAVSGIVAALIVGLLARHRARR